MIRDNNSINISFIDFISNVKHSENPNVDIIFKDNKYYFYPNNSLINNNFTINFDRFNINRSLNLKGGSIKKRNNLIKGLIEFNVLANDVLTFFKEKKFSKQNIRFLKNKINKKYNYAIKNKDLYKIGKLLKQFKKKKNQIGGSNINDGMTNNIEKLEDIERGSFIHNPQAVPFTQKINRLHLILDLFGLIPGYGIAADTINFIIYFIRGEYSDALFSLICLIPTVGSIFGIIGRYITKFFQNKSPDYRKYYKSMISLKEITKELQDIENKNLDLDTIAYKDDSDDFNP